MNERPVNISILGCGWLGQRIALQLKSDGYDVLGSFRDAEQEKVLQNKGIASVRVEVTPKDIKDAGPSFWERDVLLIALPPGKSDDVLTIYPQMIQQVVNKFVNNQKKRCRIIFISSSSVYPNDGRIVTEKESPLHPAGQSGKAILQAEKIVEENKNVEALILRCGGLIGNDRLPGSFTLKQNFRSRGDVPVNLIFGSDVARAVSFLLICSVWHEIYNLVAPTHPRRGELYKEAARLQKLPFSPLPSEKNNAFKIVSSEKIIQAGFRFQYPDLMEGLKTLYKS